MKQWHNHGLLHSFNNKPAHSDIKLDIRRFYHNGQLHRDNDNPAIISYDNVSKGWNYYFYKNGQLHRDLDKPSTLLSDGTQIYYTNGKIHRDDNKPAVINSDGSLEYYKNGVKYIPNTEMLPKSDTIINKVKSNNSESSSESEFGIEFTIKYLLTCDNLEETAQKDLINMLFKDNLIITTQDVVKLLINCKSLNEKQRQKVLHFTILNKNNINK